MSDGLTLPENRLDTLLRTHPLPTWRRVAWLVMIIVGTLLVWAHFARLDEVSITPGEVIPQGQVKAIQHLEGGIIKQIHVQEGDIVAAGDSLISLDLATSGVNREELQARLDTQILTKARLEAEAAETEPTFPADLAQHWPDQVRTERDAFEARRSELTATLRVLEEQAHQRELEVRELEAQGRATARNLVLAQERFKMSADLLRDGLTPKMEHKQLEAEVKTLEGQSEVVSSSVPRARAAVSEARERIVEARLGFRREAREQLAQAEQNIARLSELLNEATEQRGRAEIKSPIDGIVKNLRFHTIGGVVRPGEAIMEIVPSGENLVVEAKLNPTDRGYVEAGQKAVVKISTYDFARYGGLEGKVIQVAPDSSADENGTPYFRVVVKTDKTYLGNAAGELPITPGMQATVDIHTGEKTVIDYLLKPVLKLRHEAFRER